MSDVLFVTWDGGGNLPPAVGLATELAARGHHVRFLGHPSQVDHFRQAGLEFAPFPTARPFSATTPHSTLAMLAIFGDQSIGSDVVDSLSDRPADLVVVDCMLFGAMDGLRQAGLAYVVLEHLFDGYLRRALRGPLSVMLRLKGLRPLGLLADADRVLAATLAELDLGHGDVVHTGPLTRGTPSTPANPLVLLSLSTFAFPALERMWQRLLDAVDGMNARVLATTGPAMTAGRLRVPDNVEIHDWLPHAEVLPRASLVVGHGGHGTAMAALAHDVPLLILPLDAKTDQPFVGRAIERSGAGLVRSRRSSPTTIRSAIEQLLGAGPHRPAAAALGARIREQDGRSRGADLLESLIRPDRRH